MNSYVFLAAVFATPVFGWIADRFGRGGLLMMFGSLLLPLSFLILAETSWSLWIDDGAHRHQFLAGPRRTLAFGLDSGGAEAPRHGIRPDDRCCRTSGLTVCNVVVGAITRCVACRRRQSGGYMPMLAFFGALSLLGFVYAWLLRRRERGP